MRLNWKLSLLAAMALTTIPLPTLAQNPAQDPYDAVMKRDFGTAIDEMTAIEKDIEAATPDKYPAFEDHLITIVASPEATKPGKQFACQMLRIVGSPKCIPAVSALLTDEQLSHMARYVLQPMHVPAADAALRTAFGQTLGPVRIGIINTLGDRRDTMSLGPIAALVPGGDELTGRAALNAIGKIGGRPAAATLDHLKPPDTLKENWALAYLRVAENLASAGDKPHSEKMLRTLLDVQYPTPVRAAALNAFAMSQKEKAVPMIVGTLASPDPLMMRAATSAVINVPGHPATVIFSRKLAVAPNDVKPTFIAALAARGDAVGVTDSINKLTADPNEDIRKAAILALGRIGNPTSVPVLIALLKDPATRRDATRSLNDLHGAGVIEAMLHNVDTGDAETRSAVINVLAQKGQVEALPSFRKALEDPDATVRMASLAGLNVIGTPDDLKPLADHILTVTDDREREELGNTMTAIALRSPNEEARTAAALQVYSAASPAAKIRLLAVLASLGGDRALTVVQGALSEGGEVHNAALRGLAEWPNPAPMAVLLTAARDDTDKSNRIQALRGYIRMINGSGMSPSAKAQAYKDATAMAERPDEKRQALGGLAEVGTIESLRIVQPFLDDADVKREAYLAYERIAEAISGSQPDAAKEALKRVADSAEDPRLQGRARFALQRIK